MAMFTFLFFLSFLSFLLLSFQLLGAYSVSKTALLGLTKAVAQQVASDNIRVNCVAPGIVKTKFSSAVRLSLILMSLYYLFI